MSLISKNILQGGGLRACAPIMRNELRRFHFSDRERTLASLILSLTWEEGIGEVRVPKLDLFDELTGIPANHVGVALNDLVMMRVILVQEKDGLKSYALNPKSEEWQVKPRQYRTKILSALNVIREVNGLKPQSEVELNFNFSMVVSFLAELTTDSGAKPKSGGGK